MNFIRNRNFRAGPQTSLEGFICPQNSDKKQKIKVFGRFGGGDKSRESLLFLDLYGRPGSWMICNETFLGKIATTS